MFSIIIPTMWRGSEIQHEFPKIVNCNYINEIIVINNDFNSTPEWFKQIQSEKIISIVPFKNIFVNPAWNIGVKISKNSNVILFQDDIRFDNYDFLQIIEEDINQFQSLIGCSEDCYKISENKFFELKNMGEFRNYGFGCLMAFNKKYYKDIPKDFKLWKGDDFLIEKFKHINHPIKVMSGIKIYGKISQTIDGSSEFDFKYQEGNLNFNSYLTEYLND